MIELHPELARSIVDKLPGAVAVFDVDGRVVWGNAELSELLRRDPADIVGASAEELQLPLPDPDAVSSPPMGSRIVEKGRLVGIWQNVGAATFKGRVLLMMDKKYAIDWFLDVLASGSFDPSITSRLLSRNALLNRLQLEVSRSRRYANPLSCLVIRIDYINGNKQSRNETIHSLIASTVTELLRWVDVPGQWSDQALVVILPETAEMAADQLAEKLARAIDENLAHETPHVSINVGASTWRKGDDAGRLVRRAEIVARRQIGSTARTLSY
jgi:GGDEF domain-containing protein